MTAPHRGGHKTAATDLIQVNRLDRHLQFVFPFHRFFELLIDHLHAILFLHEGFLEPVFRRFLILLYFLERVLERNFLRLRLFGEDNLAGCLIDRENRVAARTMHAYCGLLPVDMWTVYYGRFSALAWTNSLRIRIAS